MKEREREREREPYLTPQRRKKKHIWLLWHIHLCLFVTVLLGYELFQAAISAHFHTQVSKCPWCFSQNPLKFWKQIGQSIRTTHSITLFRPENVMNATRGTSGWLQKLCKLLKTCCSNYIRGILFFLISNFVILKNWGSYIPTHLPTHALGGCMKNSSRYQIWCFFLVLLVYSSVWSYTLWVGIGYHGNFL